MLTSATIGHASVGIRVCASTRAALWAVPGLATDGASRFIGAAVEAVTVRTALITVVVELELAVKAKGLLDELVRILVAVVDVLEVSVARVGVCLLRNGTTFVATATDGVFIPKLATGVPIALRKVTTLPGWYPI